jgi:predicted DNA-binding transcriptional regulator YafY
MLEAIRERHAASIGYLDARNGKQTRRTIEPVGLVCRGDAWWLVAWCRLRKDARAFRVDRVSEWRTAGSFPAREGFSFDEIVQRDRHLARDLFGY